MVTLKIWEVSPKCWKCPENGQFPSKSKLKSSQGTVKRARFGLPQGRFGKGGLSLTEPERGAGLRDFKADLSGFHPGLYHKWRPPAHGVDEMHGAVFAEGAHFPGPGHAVQEP